MSIFIETKKTSPPHDESKPLFDSTEHSTEHSASCGYKSTCHTEIAVSVRVDEGTIIAITVKEVNLCHVKEHPITPKLTGTSG